MISSDSSTGGLPNPFPPGPPNFLVNSPVDMTSLFLPLFWSRRGPKQFSGSLGSLDATQSTWVDYSAQGLSTSSEVNQLRGQLAQELQWRLVNVVLSDCFSARNHPIYSVGAHGSSITASSTWPATWSGKWNPGRADERSSASPCSPEMSSLRALGMHWEIIHIHSGLFLNHYGTQWWLG